MMSMPSRASVSFDKEPQGSVARELVVRDGMTIPLIYFDSIDSTNREAMRRIMDGHYDSVVIQANNQTAGTGRFSRKWEYENGKGLSFSFVRSLQIESSLLSQSTLVVAVAIVEAIKATTGVETKIKWPNDLLVNGKKLCGILVECIFPPKNEHHDAVGIFGVGLNVSHQLDDFSEELKQRATSLYLETNCLPNKEQLFRNIIEKMDEYIDRWLNFGFSSIRDEWIKHSCMLGKKIFLLEGNEKVDGKVLGLSEKGALVIETNNGIIREIDTGEVQIARS